MEKIRDGINGEGKISAPISIFKLFDMVQSASDSQSTAQAFAANK